MSSPRTTSGQSQDYQGGGDVLCLKSVEGMCYLDAGLGGSTRERAAAGPQLLRESAAARPPALQKPHH